jgi:transcriptional regulator with XRE-family HTH domain
MMQADTISTNIDDVVRPSIVIKQQAEREKMIPTSAQDPTIASLFLIKGEQTGAPIAICIVDNSSFQIDTNNVSVSEQLHAIKKSLGLNLSQLSKVLGVSRPQLYKWLEEEVIPQKEESNQKITLLYGLLNTIPEEHGKYFGKFAKRYISPSETVIDALADQELNEEKFLEIYDSIKKDISVLENKLAKAQQNKNHLADIVLPPR